MHRRIIIGISFFAVLMVASISFAQLSIRGTGGSGFVPEPRLVYPISDEVDLSEKETLEFKWSPFEGNRAQRRYYDFRIYKGYEMLESTLMLKKRVSAGDRTIKINSETFENGMIYTWSLRQVYHSVAGKSQKSYNSFKVIK